MTMDELQVPNLDPRDEERIVVDVLDNLPAALSDRSAGAVVVKLIEAMGAIYGATLYQLNRWPHALQVQILRLLGIRPEAARSARVTLTFARDGSGQGQGPITIPKGTMVKTGSSATSIRFETDYDVVMYEHHQSVEVDATAIEVGVETNVIAGVIRTFDAPIPGIDTVTNHDAARDGADAETTADLLRRAASMIRSTDGRRAVTVDDFEAVALLYGGIQRAQVRGVQNAGWIDIDLLDSAWNDALDSDTLEDIRAFMQLRTVLGVRVRTYAAPVCQIQIHKITGTLLPGAHAQEVASAIEDAILHWLDPYKTTTLPSGQMYTWAFGRAIHENDLVALCAHVTGLERLHSIEVRYALPGQGAASFVFEDNNQLILPPYSVVQPQRDVDAPPLFEEVY